MPFTLLVAHLYRCGDGHGLGLGTRRGYGIVHVLTMMPHVLTMGEGQHYMVNEATYTRHVHRPSTSALLVCSSCGLTLTFDY
eukprot:9486777-Pyramimonas_sp.AAC.2